MRKNIFTFKYLYLSSSYLATHIYTHIHLCVCTHTQGEKMYMSALGHNKCYNWNKSSTEINNNGLEMKRKLVKLKVRGSYLESTEKEREVKCKVWKTQSQEILT